MLLLFVADVSIVGCGCMYEVGGIAGVVEYVWYCAGFGCIYADG